MKKAKIKLQCGDCDHNLGDNGKGCYCEKKRKYISICDTKCKDFVINPDIEEELLYRAGKA